MNTKTKGLIAGVAGVALLAGGSTFALWSAGDDVEGGTVTAGNLDVAIIDPPTWRDVSYDRTDYGHAITPTDFRIIPGDTIEGTYPIDVVLEGDNMLADLGLTVSGAPVSGLFALPSGSSAKYSVVRQDGSTLPGLANLPFGTPAQLKLRSQDNGADADSSITTVGKTLDGTADIKVVVTVTFSATTAGRDLTGAQAQLTNLGVTLTQSRTNGTGA